MTKEEVTIQALQGHIEALEQNGDCISRQRALEPYKTLDDNDTISVWMIRKNIEETPSVSLQSKIGHWIEERDDYGEIMNWHCSNCYEDSGFITTCKWDYCPECGARMESEE